MEREIRKSPPPLAEKIDKSGMRPVPESVPQMVYAAVSGTLESLSFGEQSKE